MKGNLMTKNDELLISILTPFYNSEKYMECPHQALLNQTYKNWEWICIDDNSTDNTLKILKDWAKKDSRIKVFHREKNGGKAAVTVNTGLLHCSGKYVQFLGHDDEITPETLSKIVKRIKETNADIVLPDALIINKQIDPKLENIEIIAVSKGEHNDFPINDRNVILTPREACKLSLNWRIHGFGCFSLELLNKFKICEEGMNGDEYSTRLFFLNANKVAFCTGCYKYIRRPTSITNKPSVKWYDVFKTEEKLSKLVRENKFDKESLKIVEKTTLYNYNSRLIKYCVDREIFSKAERKEIEAILKHGRLLILKYSGISQALKTSIKYYKIFLYYKIWKYLGNKLKKKGIIQ